jgi:hypothetical protein
MTVITGRHFVRDISILYKLLNFMTGDNIFTHQIPRAMDACKPALEARYPEIAAIQVPTDFTDSDAALAWVDEQVARIGETIPVSPLSNWEQRNPLAELWEMTDPKKVIVVEVSDDTGDTRPD